MCGVAGVDERLSIIDVPLPRPPPWWWASPAAEGSLTWGVLYSMHAVPYASRLLDRVAGVRTLALGDAGLASGRPRCGLPLCAEEEAASCVCNFLVAAVWASHPHACLNPLSRFFLPPSHPRSFRLT